MGQESTPSLFHDGFSGGWLGGENAPILEIFDVQELLKYLCVRRLLWFPFVSDSWALCCYGGAAGLGFAALEKLGKSGRPRPQMTLKSKTFPDVDQGHQDEVNIF